MLSTKVYTFIVIMYSHLREVNRNCHLRGTTPNMIDIREEIQQKMVLESKKSHHIFNNDSMTFKQLKDVFTDVFDTSIVKVSRRVPMAALYLTCKDGDFYVASCGTPEKLLDVKSVKSAIKLDECDKGVVEATLVDVVGVMKDIDPVLLNRYFANGKNMAKLSLVCPPKDCSSMYGGKCFVTLDGIDCFDGDCKCIGQDQDAGMALVQALKADGRMASEMNALTAEQLAALKKCRDEKKVLDVAVA